MNNVKIFVFGSCHTTASLESDESIGIGGYGVVISINGTRTEAFADGFSNTTNARMDIVGITEGIKKIKEPSNVEVYLMNGYVIDTLSKGWLEKWKREGYKKKKHVDLWKKLDSALRENKDNIKFLHARDVKYHPDYKKAEELGKTMSGKKNLPVDLGMMENIVDIFKVTENNSDITEHLEMEDTKPILDAICVDASCIGNPGKMEYRGFDIETGKLIFERKYDEATNNIGEFLAIVLALAICKRKGNELKVIYSDSQNAISWINQKVCKTKLVKNEKNYIVFEDIEKAITWLKTNTYDTKILKWNTVAWGEIPADYGRK